MKITASTISSNISLMWRIISRGFKSQLIFTISINGLLAVLALATGSMAARLLGVEGRGELAAIQLWPTFLAGISMLGLSESIVYFTAKNTQLAGRNLISAISLTLILSIPFMGLGYLLIPFLLPSQSPTVIWASRIYLLMIPLYSLVGLPLQMLRGRNDLTIWNILRLAQPFGWLLILLVLFMSGIKSAAVTAIAYLIMVGLLFFPFAFIIYKRVSGPFSFDRSLWNPMLRFGIPSMAASFPAFLNLRLDQMMMAAFLSSEVLGLYVVSVAWASAVSPLLDAFSVIIFPHVAAQSVNSERTRVLIQRMHMAVLVGIGLIICLEIITPFAFPLIFGKDFSQAIPSALILIIAGVVSSINSVLENGVRGLGNPSVVLKSECIGLVATIISLALLLRPLGIIGASISSFLGYSGTLFALLFQTSKIIDTHPAMILMPDREDLSRVLKQTRILLKGS